MTHPFGWPLRMRKRDAVVVSALPFRGYPAHLNGGWSEYCNSLAFPSWPILMRPFWLCCVPKASLGHYLGQHCLYQTAVLFERAGGVQHVWQMQAHRQHGCGSARTCEALAGVQPHRRASEWILDDVICHASSQLGAAAAAYPWDETRSRRRQRPSTRDSTRRFSSHQPEACKFATHLLTFRCVPRHGMLSASTLVTFFMRPGCIHRRAREDVCSGALGTPTT